MSFIEFKNVSFDYEGENAKRVEIFKNLNLNIEQGEYVAVLGHNGSGKSTFAKLINGLLEPVSGEVLVSGISTADESRRLELLQQVGMIFQNPDNQIVATIIEEDVAFGPENLGVPPDEIRRRVDESLKTVGMYEYRHSEPANLSGGQKQRVAIAGILAMNTKCIVMDESTAMLDPIGRKEVMQTVKALNREKGITVIYITHFMDEACDADRVLVMNDGDIIMDNSPKNVFKNSKRLKEVGLDIPQSLQLLELLGSDETALNADECVAALEKIIR